jgi:hypothetical protein
MRKALPAAMAVPALVLVLAACGDTDTVPEKGQDLGVKVVHIEPGFDMYRLCDGTTAIYTMDDYNGWDFQVVLDDPKCVVAK